VAAAGLPRGEHLLPADELVNTRAATEARHRLIVLDDRHRFEDPAVFEFLDLRLERLPLASGAWRSRVASNGRPHWRAGMWLTRWPSPASRICAPGAPGQWLLTRREWPVADGQWLLQAMFENEQKRTLMTVPRRHPASTRNDPKPRNRHEHPDRHAHPSLPDPHERPAR
jgi:hypothetical protein